MQLKLLFIYLLFSMKIQANDSLLIPKLFQSLLNKQQLEDNFFKRGSFTSFRQYAKKEYLEADNNVFYTALISYTLNHLKPYLTVDEEIVVDTITNRAKKVFENYRNAKGRLSYNFWPTTNGKIFFPNNSFLSLFKNSLALPDDLDDTGIILSSMNLSDSIASIAHQIMQQFVNNKSRTIKNTYQKYSKYKAYSTWYGEKMPIDFDFGVHCNILSFVNQYNLQWSSADSATYQLILKMIDDKLYLTNPEFISPYYDKSSILLYHIARLMQTKNLPELELKRKQFIAEARELYTKSNSTLEKIILQTCLLKWNDDVELTKQPEIHQLDDLYTTEFVYYTGHLFAHLNYSVKTIANQLAITQFKWFSSAFNDCLLLENLVLKYRRNLTNGH